MRFFFIFILLTSRFALAGLCSGVAENFSRASVTWFLNEGDYKKDDTLLATYLQRAIDDSRQFAIPNGHAYRVPKEDNVESVRRGLASFKENLRSAIRVISNETNPELFIMLLAHGNYTGMYRSTSGRFTNGLLYSRLVTPLFIRRIHIQTASGWTNRPGFSISSWKNTELVQIVERANRAGWAMPALAS